MIPSNSNPSQSAKKDLHPNGCRSFFALVLPTKKQRLKNETLFAFLFNLILPGTVP